jgi:hypothetical protein
LNNAQELLAQTNLVVHRGPYALGAWNTAQVSAVYAGLLRGHESLAFVTMDDREATALLRESTLSELPPPKNVQRGWVVITLDTVFEWDVIGILAVVSGALADAGIPIGAATAFSRDHILVPASRLREALSALKGLCGEVSYRD